MEILTYKLAKDYLIEKGYWTYVADLSEEKIIEFANKVLNNI